MTLLLFPCTKHQTPQNAFQNKTFTVLVFVVNVPLHPEAVNVLTALPVVVGQASERLGNDHDNLSSHIPLSTSASGTIQGLA